MADKNTNPSNRGKVLKELYTKNLQLHRERKRLHQILTQVAEVIFAVNEEYKITLINTSAEKLFGIKSSEIVNREADEYIPLFLDDSKERLSVKDFCFKEKKDTVFNLNDAGPDLVRVRVDMPQSKSLYFKLTYANIKYGSKSKKECVIALSNITQEVELDKQKDDFISIASHELKTPISIIKTNLWMFKHISETNLNDKQEHLIKEVDYGLSRLARIVNNLLDISRIEQGRFVIEEGLNDVNDVINTSINTFKDLAGKKNLKIVPPKSKVGKVYIDKDRFLEVLDNFISNAIKYTEEGGIKINVWDKDKFIKVAVTDTGPGISKKEQKRLFKKFSRAKEGLKQHSLGASTGLGLYISKRIIEEMGGKVGLKSKVGKGSTFWFTIPKGKKKYKTDPSIKNPEKIKKALMQNKL